MKAKIRFNTMPKSMNSHLTMTYYGFLGFHQSMIEGKIEDLAEMRLTVKGEEVQTETAYREFLTRLSALGYDVDRLDADEKKTLQLIQKYLSVPYTEGEEKASNNDNAPSIEEQIKSKEKAEEKTETTKTTETSGETKEEEKTDEQLKEEEQEKIEEKK